jgi:hypothetical protein
MGSFFYYLSDGILIQSWLSFSMKRIPQRTA